MRSVLVASCLAWVGVFVPTSGRAHIAKIELHALATRSPTDQEFLTGRKDGKAVTITGELRIPRPGADRLPCVVLLHGAGGVSGVQDAWARELNAAGVATFIVDSFTGRGIASMADDPARLGRLAMVLDAYAALELLARHPRIDARRISVMGFSRGGHAALYAALQRFWSLHGPGEGVRFAAYVALYPLCNTAYRGELDVADRPIRIFHGAADDYVPVAPCREYVERLRQAGKDASLVEYPGAHHAFDDPALATPVKLPSALTTRNCRFEEGPDGRIVNRRTRRPFDYADPCVERGTTMAHDPRAHAAAVEAVRRLVTTALLPQ
jgi:dienelactone hydrolase